MNLHDFSYELPKELIAQDPIPQRDHSRLMLVQKETGEVRHEVFCHIDRYLKKGDCLVINDTKVIPARLFGSRPGKEEKIEILLLTRKTDRVWECLAKPGKKVKPQTKLIFGEGKLTAECVGVSGDGNRLISFQYEGIFEEILDELGQMPLPPYITHTLEDKTRYQTVYAKYDGSAAAPTAGLHFTEELLDRIRKMGVAIAPVTLHVGLGTFRPVKTENILEHHMHSEYYSISAETARTINETKRKGGRVICVGTTSCRTVEAAAQEDGFLKECSGWTDIFIYPGYRFRVLDCLITNFHLPESTLLMLVSALAGREHILAAYEEAVRERYRFFSFGDAMFLTDDILGEYRVRPLKKPFDRTVTVPGSKSMTNRALLMASLGEGKTTLKGAGFSEDSRCFLEALRSLGFRVETDEQSREISVWGLGGSIPAADTSEAQREIFVGSAGTAARFLTAMLGFCEGTFVVNASAQMKLRPMKELFDALTSLGVSVVFLEKEGCLPVRITGNPNAGGTVSLDISRSTQFLSALLLTAPMLKRGLRIRVSGAKKTGSYIRITMNMMEQFGVHVDFSGEEYAVGTGRAAEADILRDTEGAAEAEAVRDTEAAREAKAVQDTEAAAEAVRDTEAAHGAKENTDSGKVRTNCYRSGVYEIEPDVSAACYFYAMAFITGGRALVKGVHGNSVQGDMKFLSLLKTMGAKTEETREGIVLYGPEGGKFQGIEVDMNDFSDQAMTLAAIAPFALSPVTIKNVGHIRRQESDRLAGIAQNLRRLKVTCEERPDSITIYPDCAHSGFWEPEPEAGSDHTSSAQHETGSDHTSNPEPEAEESISIETYEDHRMAMAFAVTGIRRAGVIIKNPACCKKTFEEYFDVLEN